eukprot:12459668-Alexandrium_andersonii.AAC.1
MHPGSTCRSRKNLPCAMHPEVLADATGSPPPTGVHADVHEEQLELLLADLGLGGGSEARA